MKVDRVVIHPNIGPYYINKEISCYNIVYWWNIVPTSRYPNNESEICI